MGHFAAKSRISALPPKADVCTSGSFFPLIGPCICHSKIDRNGFSEPPSVYRRRLRQRRHRSRHFHLSNRRPRHALRAARCSCCRGRRTSCVTSISCATLRLRLGYRVIRQDYNRDGENQETAVLFHCAFSSTVWSLPGNSREPPLEVTSRSFVIG